MKQYNKLKESKVYSAQT